MKKYSVFQYPYYSLNLLAQSESDVILGNWYPRKRCRYKDLQEDGKYHVKSFGCLIHWMKTETQPIH